jgi:hypothetical protein
MTQAVTRKNSISGLVYRRVLAASPSSISYCGCDSKCDCYGHIGEHVCLQNCPFDHCLHDFEHDSETRSVRIAEHQISAKRPVYANIENDY